MSYNLEHKFILVLGGGGLLGGAIISAALKKGASVIAADIDVGKMAERLEKQWRLKESAKLSLISLDVTNEKQVNELFASDIKLDGIVNATYPRNSEYGKNVLDVTLSGFNDNLSLHLGSAFLVMQQSAIYFQKHKSPLSVVNISSVYGLIAPKFEVYANTSMTMPVEYAAIKSAILHLSKYFVSYIKDSRFRSNCVSPGGIFDKQPDNFLNAYKAQTCGAGMLDVEQITGGVLFLISDDAKYVTGQNIVVDDGFSL
ncbi:oxidoreductase [Pseudoalteromonas sp. MMG022]|uniref:oxidoreductase n=1 Tax=Pseudoalteromonas sp. MMG022 TaxID=2909978 RepID=UPI001EFF0771|nr:oxidoreductase [Pseudoalteromonas sp. MMG022]MCF6434975.1 SDR family oxidoreductase [Pseudoalteromonas sp. MMG022]